LRSVSPLFPISLPPPLYTPPHPSTNINLVLLF